MRPRSREPMGQSESGTIAGLGGSTSHGAMGNDHRRIVGRRSLRISYRRRSVPLPSNHLPFQVMQAGAWRGLYIELPFRAFLGAHVKTKLVSPDFVGVLEVSQDF